MGLPITKINGQEFGGDRGWKNHKITIDFESGNELKFNISSINLVGDVVQDVILPHLRNGLNGGGGYFEALEYSYKPDRDKDLEFLGILDWTDDSTEIGCEEVVVKVKEKQNLDWLISVAGGYSFASLYGEGIITNADFVDMEYVINYIPDGLQLIMLAISTFILTKELIQVIREISDGISELINAVTPNTGLFVTWDVGDLIWMVLKLIARLVYAIAIVVALVKMIEMIIEQLIPKKREHKGMKILTMFEKICQKMGYTLSSDLLTNTPVKDWAIIPRKFKKGGEENPETGYPDANSPIYTADKFLETMLIMFNAKITIIGNTFYFERRDRNVIPTTWTIKPFYNNQERQLMESTKNFDEIRSNYLISHQYDVQDQNTLDEVAGFHYQQQLTNSGVTDPAKNLLKGLTEINTPFSLGRRKNILTELEKVLKAFAVFADAVTGQLGSASSFASKIQNRVGSCLMSDHKTSVMKLVDLNGSKLKTNQRQRCSAKYLWENFHLINSSAPIQTAIGEVHNQWYLFNDVPVKMDEEILLSLLNNNNADTQDGEVARVSKIEYDGDKKKAIINYRINKLYHTSFNVSYYGE